MNIEKRIDILVSGRLISVNHWRWYEENVPRSLWVIGRSHYDAHYVKLYQDLDAVIENTNVLECMTSPSEYIRECKKWYLRNKDCQRLKF